MKQITLVMYALTFSIIIPYISARRLKPDCSYLGETIYTDKFQRCIRRMWELQEIITLLCNFGRPEGEKIRHIPSRQIGDLFCECCHRRCSRRKLMSHCS